MEPLFHRLIGILRRREDSLFPAGQRVPFAVRTATGLSHTFGDGAPAFAVVAVRENGLRALSTMDLSHIAEAYMGGDLDVEGDLRDALRLRTAFGDSHPLAVLWRFVQPRLFGQVQSDHRWIAKHYDYPKEFWLSFLDTRHRCYSHGFFAHDDESLEDAMSRKLDFALEAVGAKSGDHLLDIGGGWGAMTEHAGRRGIRVTSLTISKASESFLRALIAEQRLPCRVILQHLMEHVPERPYDAIVNLGVTEHLPDYRATLGKYLALLRPGGKIYLDASADRRKHQHSTFLERHLYPGNGSLLVLHEYLEEVARTSFRLLGVHDDRHSYYLTCRHWAERLDHHREFIERSWGREVYRKYRLYLWGSADGFDRDLLQAYHWIMQKPADAD